MPIRRALRGAVAAAMRGWHEADLRTLRLLHGLLLIGFGVTLGASPYLFESRLYAGMNQLASATTWGAASAGVGLMLLLAPIGTKVSRLAFFLACLVNAGIAWGYTVGPLGPNPGTATYAVLALFAGLAYVKSGYARA